ncbi:hypothetical protein GNX18_06940 [Microbulbifer sp. SH-1]|uniref:Imm74 family immunity protein n=1 Tax=Microbulbifer sp. SH-1 TaxID=2681547 RepID=UPI00140A4611|nr:Imm74 family immunity protein [Microbulbifer sp. SH-1]QIL89519.1 hypothetical protein GNX18_06940 [Microbulbifer sp. SH-1]
MIKEITRGHIILETKEGVVRILGEALLPGYGSPDFVVYENSIKEWLEPANELISPNSKRNILKQLKKDAKEKQLNIEIE